MAAAVLIRPRRSRPRSPEAGLTIVELLVALGVSLIGLMGLMSLFTAAARANAVAADTAVAVDVASTMLEDLSSTPVAELEAEYAPIDTAGWGPVDYHLGQTVGRRGAVLDRRVFARSVFGTPGLVWLRADVVWRDPGAGDDTAPRRVSLETTVLREATP